MAHKALIPTGRSNSVEAVTEKGFINFAARESRGAETAGRRDSDETAR
jgi:hypothetical protein